jgi:hypothetical protein
MKALFQFGIVTLILGAVLGKIMIGSQYIDEMKSYIKDAKPYDYFELSDTEKVNLEDKYNFIDNIKKEYVTDENDGVIYKAIVNKKYGVMKISEQLNRVKDIIKFGLSLEAWIIYSVLALLAFKME